MIRSARDFATLEQRQKFLEEWKAMVTREFGSGFYLSVFGSFVREDFRPGESDIDIGFYAENPRESFFIKDFIMEYFGNETDVDVQIVNIAFTDYCWIYLNVLSDGVVLCDGYLDELRVFQRRLRRQYREWKPQYDRHCQIQNAMYRNRQRRKVFIAEK